MLLDLIRHHCKSVSLCHCAVSLHEYLQIKRMECQFVLQDKQTNVGGGQS